MPLFGLVNHTNIFSVKKYQSRRDLLVRCGLVVDWCLGQSNLLQTQRARRFLKLPSSFAYDLFFEAAHVLHLHFDDVWALSKIAFDLYKSVIDFIGNPLVEI